VADGRITLDDGTATAAIVLPSDAVGLASDVRTGDPINVIGLVVPDGDAWAVAPESAADIARVGRLGESVPFATPPAASPEPALVERRELAAHDAWPIGAVPTLAALAGTAAMVALRRREVRELARRLAAALPHDGRIGAARTVLAGAAGRVRGRLERR
jgi:hypothetical protein